MGKRTEKPVAQINFQDIGAGNVIVLLHGFMESLKIWDKIAEVLAESFRVISIDLPGHGKSSIIADTHPMELMAEEVKNILEILGINKCILVGHSMGGYVSMAFADLYPNLLKGLVLFHSHASADTSEAKIKRDRTIKVVGKDHINFIKEFIPDLYATFNLEKFNNEIENNVNMALQTSKDGIIAALKGMKSRKNRVEILNKLKIPILLIAGKYDKIIPVETLLGQIDNKENVVINILDDAGHMGMIESKGESIKILKDFSNRIYK